MLYANVVLVLVGIPLILGLAAEEWTLSAAMTAMFFLCVVPVGLVLHARNCQPARGVDPPGKTGSARKAESGLDN